MNAETRARQIFDYAVVGLVVGAILAALVGLLAVFAGQPELRSARTGASVPVWVIVVTYIVGGAWAGFVAGMLKAWLSRPWGGPVIGLIAGLPITFAIVVQITPPSAELFDADFFVTWFMSAVLLGAGGGWAVQRGAGHGTGTPRQ